MKEIPLDNLSLFGFEIRLDVSQIIREGLLDQLLKLTKITDFSYLWFNYLSSQMLSEKSVKPLLQFVEGYRRAGQFISFLNYTYTLFLSLVTMDALEEAPEAVGYILNRNIAKTHFLDIIRSQLSTKTVIEIIGSIINYQALLPLLLQAGRDKQDILGSSIFSKANKVTFRSLENSGLEPEAVKALGTVQASVTIFMAFLSDVNADHLERLARRFVPTIHTVMLALHALVPMKTVLMICRLMKARDSNYRTVGFYKAELSYMKSRRFWPVKFPFLS